jgi:hypothetical protein
VVRTLCNREISDVLLHAAVRDGVYVDLNAQLGSRSPGTAVFARVRTDPPSIRIDRGVLGRRRFAFTAAYAYGLLVLNDGGVDALRDQAITADRIGSRAGEASETSALHRAARVFAARLLRRLA